MGDPRDSSEGLAVAIQDSLLAKINWIGSNPLRGVGKNNCRIGPIHLSVCVSFGDFSSVTQPIPCQPFLLADTEEVALNAACCACMALERKRGLPLRVYSPSFKVYLKNAPFSYVMYITVLKPMETWNNVSIKNGWCHSCIPSA